MRSAWNGRLAIDDQSTFELLGMQLPIVDEPCEEPMEIQREQTAPVQGRAWRNLYGKCREPSEESRRRQYLL